MHLTVPSHSRPPATNVCLLHSREQFVTRPEFQIDSRSFQQKLLLCWSFVFRFTSLQHCRTVTLRSTLLTKHCLLLRQIETVSDNRHRITSPTCFVLLMKTDIILQTTPSSEVWRVADKKGQANALPYSDCIIDQLCHGDANSSNCLLSK